MGREEVGLERRRGFRFVSPRNRSSSINFTLKYFLRARCSNQFDPDKWYAGSLLASFSTGKDGIVKFLSFVEDVVSLRSDSEGGKW